MKFVPFLSALVLCAASQLSAAPASVRLVHGIPGLDVSVSLGNLGCKARNFKFGDVAAPLPLPAGTYQVSIHPGADCTAAAIEGFANLPVTVADNEDVTLAAHLTAAGTPTISRFDNPAARPAAGRARVIVHHVAAAPEVDVTFERMSGKAAVVPDFANQSGGGAPILLELKPGEWQASVSVAGSNAVALGPLHLSFAANQMYLIYAIGSAVGGTLDVKAIVVPLPQPPAAQ
jgi:hypothetical protein